MRIENIQIDSWRNLEDISVTVPSDQGLVCLVGENGTGKSNLLELVCYAASRFGLAQGLDLDRGDPAREEHRFTVDLIVDADLREGLIDEAGFNERQSQTLEDEWDGRLRLQSSQDDQTVTASAVQNEANARNFGGRLVSAIQNRKAIHYLWLDSDRAYPPKTIRKHEFGEAMDTDYESLQTRERHAFVPTRTKYQEWLKFMVSREVDQSTELASRHREAKREGEGPPVFEDSFEAYGEEITAVLPHMEFDTVETDKGTIRFKVGGEPLTFDKLSAGEKEIAFLIGQIHRFSLERGLFLLDEPELHLNPDLIRQWVRYLASGVESGQIWLATQSLEAAEAARAERTLLLSREDPGEPVRSAEWLSDRPSVGFLARALGNPAFSLRNKRFVFIEGDPEGGEKERFERLMDSDCTARFVEGDGCTQVLRRLETFERLRDGEEEQLVGGAVIDRDFRDDADLIDLENGRNLHVLRCHEVENLFLHPEALQQVMERAGVGGDDAHRVLVAAGDQLAGRWILGCAMSQKDELPAGLETDPDPDRSVRTAAGELDWRDFEEDTEEAIQSIVDAMGLDAEVEEAVGAVLDDAVERYSTLREQEDEYWKLCSGKEVLRMVYDRVGAGSRSALESQILSVWENDGVEPPEALYDLRAFVDGLAPGA